MMKSILGKTGWRGCCTIALAANLLCGIASAQAQSNLANGAQFSASSTVDVYTAANAKDGNQDSYWESANNAFPQSLTADFGSVKRVESVSLKLPAVWGARNQILTISGSNDGGSYTTLAPSASYTFNPASGNTVNIDFADSDVRFVRATITGNSGWPAGQVSEMEIYGSDSSSSSSSSSSSGGSSSGGSSGGTPGGDPITAGAATASSAVGHLPASNLIDGNQATYWESTGALPQSATIDLGGAHFIDQVVMKLPADTAWQTRTQTVTIYGSNDGVSFSPIVGPQAFTFDPASGNIAGVAFAEAATQYVRLSVSANTGWSAAQFSEVEIYGYPDPVPPPAPDNLTIAGGTTTTLFLSWNGSALAEGYEVLRDGSVIADVTETSFADSGLTPDTSYSYRVRAHNSFGVSADSNTVTGTTQQEGSGPDPTLRGASMPYTIYQAESGVTGGGAQVLAPNRTIGDLAGEASGRSAVTLNSTGAFVEFTTVQDTNTLVTRFSIPDAPGGGGISATLNVYVDGQFEEALSLTSKHAWLYGNEAAPQDNPGAGAPRHIYDEANLIFDRVIPAGSSIRLQKDQENSSQYAIDFISLELVSPIPNPNPASFVTPNGFTHQAVQQAITDAASSGAEGVYLPAGNYETNYKFQVTQTPLKIVGAGPWYTRFHTPSTQTNTDAGFAVSSAANGSTFANFAFFGNYVSRIDGPGKVFDFNGVRDMTLDNLWVEHQVVMFWGASVHDTTISNARIRNTFADGVNFTNGSSGNHVYNSEARSTGDDSFALFAATDNGGGIVQDNLYENLTAMTPWRAAGLASYGGQGNSFRNIHVEDTLTYSGVTISSLDFGYAFTGFQYTPTTNFEGITILRSGGHFWGNQVFPAMWLFSASSTFRGIRISDLDIVDPTYHGIMFQTKYSGSQHENVFEDTVFTNVTISGAKVDAQYPNRSGFGIWSNPLPEAGQGPAVGSVEFNNLSMFNNVVNIKDDSPDFHITINGFNDGGSSSGGSSSSSSSSSSSGGSSSSSSSSSGSSSSSSGGSSGSGTPQPVQSGKTLTVSSQDAYHTAANSLDGNQGTYWESAQNAFPQSITVNLGSTHFVSRVVMKLPNLSAWEPRTQTIEIRGSGDGSNYSTLASGGYLFAPASSNSVTVDFAEAPARYVQLVFTGNTAWPAAQLSELEIHGYPDPVPPGVPQNLTVTGATDTSIFLSWQADALATGYEVFRNGASVATVSGSSFEDTGLSAETSYDYAVRALNQYGESALSNSITGTTLEEGSGPVPHPEPNSEHGAAVLYDRYDTYAANIGGGATVQTAPTFDQSLIASEASELSYVTLPSSGSFAEWTVRDGEGGAGVTMRFTMPDSGDGMGLNGSLDVYVNGQFTQTVTLTSYYAWQYFSGDQPADAPGGGRPLFRFDEVHWKLAAPLAPGDVIRIQKGGDGIEYGVDFLEIEPVPAPIARPGNSVSVTDYGATPNDGSDDLWAFEDAVDQAVATGQSLYIPPGTFHLGNMWQVGSVGNMIQDLTVMGAGIWHTNLQFTNANAAAGGISLRILGQLDFSHVYMNSNLRSRYGQNAIYKGFMDNFGTDSRIHNVWLEHFEAGFWVGDYAHNPVIHAENLLIEHSRIRNNLADGVNFAQGTSNSTVRNCSVRNNGDDGLAVWTSNYNAAPAGVNNLFTHNTIENNWRAAAIAFFGGSGHRADFNLIVDTVGGSGFRMNTVFPGYHFQNNTGIEFADSTIIRSGSSQDLYDGERGAIDLEASTNPIRNVTISRIDIYDTQRSALQVGYGGGFENVVFNDIVIDGTGLDGVTSSRFASPHPGAAFFSYTGNGTVTINNWSTSDVAHPDTIFIQPGFNLIIQ